MVNTGPAKTVILSEAVFPVILLAPIEAVIAFVVLGYTPFATSPGTVRMTSKVQDDKGASSAPVKVKLGGSNNPFGVYCKLPEAPQNVPLAGIP